MALVKVAMEWVKSKAKAKEEEKEKGWMINSIVHLE